MNRYTSYLILGSLALVAAVLVSDPHEGKTATLDDVAAEITKVRTDVASISASTSASARNQILASALSRLSGALIQVRDVQLEVISREIASTSAEIASIGATTTTQTRDRILVTAASRLNSYLPQLVQFKLGLGGTGAASIILSQGDRGSAVIALQQVLARDASIYPKGLVTGYFGPLTEAALMRFQFRYGIPASGSVDSMTLVKLTQIYGASAITIGN